MPAKVLLEPRHVCSRCSNRKLLPRDLEDERPERVEWREFSNPGPWPEIRACVDQRRQNGVGAPQELTCLRVRDRRLLLACSDPRPLLSIERNRALLHGLHDRPDPGELSSPDDGDSRASRYHAVTRWARGLRPVGENATCELAPHSPPSSRCSTRSRAARSPSSSSISVAAIFSSRCASELVPGISSIRS